MANQTLRQAVEALRDRYQEEGIRQSDKNSSWDRDEEFADALTAALAQPDAGEAIEASVVRDLPGCPVSARCVLDGCRDFAPPALSAEEWADIIEALDFTNQDILAAKCRTLAERSER